MATITNVTLLYCSILTLYIIYVYCIIYTHGQYTIYLGSIIYKTQVHTMVHRYTYNLYIKASYLQ